MQSLPVSEWDREDGLWAGSGWGVMAAPCGCSREATHTWDVFVPLGSWILEQVDGLYEREPGGDVVCILVDLVDKGLELPNGLAAPSDVISDSYAGTETEAGLSSHLTPARPTNPKTPKTNPQRTSALPTITPSRAGHVREGEDAIGGPQTPPIQGSSHDLRPTGGQLATIHN